MATLTGVVTAQVNVAQEQLPAFLKTAEKLKIKGLAEGTQGSDNWEDFVKPSFISKSKVCFATDILACKVAAKILGLDI